MTGRLTCALVCVLVLSILPACGKSDGPPIPIKYLQVQASYLSEGYDVFQYVSVKQPVDRTPDKLDALLDYFEAKYKNEGKVRVTVFPDAASAIQGVSNNILATLEMKDGKVVSRTVNVT
jgi:hypothetical protein